MLSIAALTFLAGLMCTNANVWRVLRQEEPEIVWGNETDTSEPPDQECFNAMQSCANKLTYQPQLYTIDQHGISFSKETIDSFCSAGDQYFPCLEETMPDLEICDNVTLLIQPSKELYEFGCISNRPDINEFLSCANNKFLQFGVVACKHEFIGESEMLRNLESRGIVIANRMKHSLLCGIVDKLKRCISSEIHSYCGLQHDATGRKLTEISVKIFAMDIGFNQVDSCQEDSFYY